ncbi:putative aldouronate transport system permease protein [Promicromonospora sp. AC04]|uniref:ABC transporter permease n=1 Tax=Promicromonospora sp. AC04 TaxID=2135723 RepID=UPI000D42577B|nr:ABC transporter permease subunit [Promicromonospora sp. AC04]PUB23535.1 putative aldouronate transport system permease protein [Promicromonospora sp. AC04]
MATQANVARQVRGGRYEPLPARSRKSLLRRIGDNRTLLLMCLPAIVFFLVFSYAPMPGVWIAFTNFNYRDGIFGSPFVGLRNFEFLIQSGQLWLLTKNTILYNVAFIVLGNILQIALAIMLNEIRSKYFKKISQAAMFLPYFISVVLVGVIAFNLLNYDTGVVNALIEQSGGDPLKIYSMAGLWPIIIILFWLWQSTGYGSIVYFAAIMGIDNSLFEAAAIDGASAWQRIRYIILPSLKPTFIILLLFSLGGIMSGNFGLFWNLVGNNAALFQTTDIIETSVYRMIISQNNFTSSTAVGLYQSLFGFALVMTCNYVVRKINEDYALF